MKAIETRLLEELNFESMTGSLWRHERIGIIQVSSDDNVNDLVQKIYNRGAGEKQLEIRIALGIKDILG